MKITHANYQDQKSNINWGKMPEWVDKDKMEQYHEVYEYDEDIKKFFNEALEDVNEIMSSPAPEPKKAAPKAAPKKDQSLTRDEWIKVITKIHNEFYSDYSDDKPEDYADNISITVDQALLKRKSGSFSSNNYESEVSMGEALKTLKSKLTKKELDAIEFLSETGDRADAEDHDEEQTYTQLTIERLKSLLPETKKAAPKAAAPKKAAPKKRASSKSKLDDVLSVPSYSEQVKVLRRVLNLHDKSKTPKAFLDVGNAIKRANIEGRIKAKDKHGTTIQASYDWIADVHEEMVERDRTMSTNDIPEPLLTKVKMAVHSEEVYPAVFILKAFVSMQGKKPSIEKAQRLLKRINGRMQSKDIVAKYKKDVMRIKGVLEKYIDSRTTTIDVDSSTLNGLNCACEDYGDVDVSEFNNPDMDEKKKPNNGEIEWLPSAPQHYAPQHNNHQSSQNYEAGGESHDQADYDEGYKPASSLDGFTSSDQLVSGSTETLPGPIGKLLGPMELDNEYAISLQGDQGSGKSQFMFQLADAFADMNKRVGFFSLEMSKTSSKVATYRDKHIKPQNHSKVMISSEAKDGIMSVRKVAKDFDVIFIDSFTSLNEKSEEFGKLRADFPQTKFIVIFQSTTGKTARGGSRSSYDCDVELYTVKADDTFVNNYVTARKNRMHPEGIKYNIASKSIISDTE